MSTAQRAARAAKTRELVEPRAAAFELRYLVVPAALQVRRRRVVELAIGEYAFSIPDHRREGVGEGAVEAPADKRVCGRLGVPATADKDLGQIDQDSVFLLPRRPRGRATAAPPHDSAEFAPSSQAIETLVGDAA